jgi:hypothetical protein
MECVSGVWWTHSTLGLTTEVLSGNEASSSEEESSLHFECMNDLVL